MTIRRNLPIPSCRFSFDDLTHLYRKLQTSCDTAFELHKNSIRKPESGEEDSYQKYIDSLKEAYMLSVVINGVDGSTLVEHGNKDVFVSGNIPKRISSIYIDSRATFYAKFGFEPNNWFQLNIDLTKPPILDWINSLSAPTPNETNIVASGDNDIWISGVCDTIVTTLNAKNKNIIGIIHVPFFYEIMLLVFGIPFSLYLCHLVSKIRYIEDINSSVIETATFIYIFFSSLFFFPMCIWIYEMDFSQGRTAR